MAKIKYFAAALVFTACAGNVPANNANAANTAEKTAPAAPTKDALVTLDKECIRGLDVGCGDGVLTKKIADFVASARKLGLTVVEKSASDMDFGPRFDAVFGNAALHWMKDADAVIGRVARVLLPNGRFVAEMGGHGCVKTLLSALIEELDRRGHDGQAANPWYFPTVEDYGGRLAAAGFDVRYIALILNLFAPPHTFHSPDLSTYPRKISVRTTRATAE
jgi:ubiquinone/menaquinone biosynthesis C-methylase UbiE